MIQRYPCQAVIMAVCGILLQKALYLRQDAGRQDFWGLAALFLLTAAVCLAGIWIRREPAALLRCRQAVLLLLAFGIGTARLRLVSEELKHWQAGLTDGQELSVQGRIVKKQRREANVSDSKAYQAQAAQQEVSWTLYLTDGFRKTSDGILPCGDVIVYVNLNGSEPVIGNTIIVTGNVKMFGRARNDGNFDERAYQENMGYALKVYAKKGAYQVADAHADRLRESLYGIQQKFARVYGQKMPRQEAGALSAMLLGEKSQLLSETKELYRRSGIAHILAISGLHISILGAAVYGLLRKAGRSCVTSAAVSMGLLVLFAFMTGMSVSTMRALVMFGIYLGAACCGRAYDSANGLAVAAACILFWNPRVLFLAGFQFSFAAVAGVLFGKEICRIFRPKLRLSETVMVSFGIQMVTLPLTAWYYFEIPVYSILLNMLVLPLMELALVTGLLGGGLGVAGGVSGTGIVAVAGALCGKISDGMLAVCTLTLKYFNIAGEAFLALPGAVCVTGKPQAWQICVYYFVLGVCVWAIKKGEKMTVLTRGEKDGLLRKQKAVLSAGCVACLFLLFLRLPKQAEVSLLDVGQGDGIYIRTGDGTDVFIDGGSNDVSGVGTYRILPFLKAWGVADVDTWFVSHLDKDHISGLEEIVESGYKIGQVVFAKEAVRDEAYARVVKLLEQKQIGITHLKEGDTLRGARAGFTCLAPDIGGEDRNAQSLVLLYEDSGFSGFFPGDISEAEERKLTQEGNLAHVTLYKAAHHGSKYSNTREILRQLQPVVSVISCAEKNDYGHPGKEAVAHMEENSEAVYDTMRAGRVRITWEKGNVKVRGFVPMPVR